MRESFAEKFRWLEAAGKIPCERFMLGRAAYGGLHHVPAIMFRSNRNRFLKRRPFTLKPCFAYEWERRR
jgi:hypothetical protein